MLYQLSYLARCGRSLASARFGAVTHRGEALDEALDEVLLEHDRVCAGLGDRLVQLRVGIAGEREQTQARMVLA